MAETTFPAVSSEAAEWITNNPNRAADFDLKYGTGAANQILNPPPPSAETVEEENDGWIKDVGKGIVESAVSAVRETAQFFGDVGQGQNLDPFDPAHYGLQRPLSSPTGRDFAAGQARDAEIAATNQSMQQTLDQMTIFGEERDTTAGAMTQGVLQFLVGLYGVGKLSRMKTITSFKGSLAGGAVVDYAMFDPDTPNLVRVAEEAYGIDAGLMTDILANSGDNKWEDRLRNAAVGGIVGGTVGGSIELLILGVKGWRLRGQAQKELNETGSISEATQKEVAEVENQIKSFADVSGKPKGAFSDDGARFITDEGMVFDTASGIRMVDEEAAVKRSVLGTKPKAPELENQKIDIPENPALRTDAEVDVPQALKAPERNVDEVLPSSANSADNVASREAPTAPKDAPTSAKAPKVDAVPAPKISTQTAAPAAPKPQPRRKPFNPKPLLEAVEVIRKDPSKIQQVDELLSDRFVFNPKYYEGPRNAEAVLKATAQQLEAQGLFKATDVKTFAQHTEEVIDLTATELGVGVDNFRVNLAKVAQSAEDQGKWLTAGRIHLTSIQKQMDELGEQIDATVAKGEESEALYTNYLELIDLHADIQQSVQGIRTATGRNLNINKVLVNPELSDLAVSRLERAGGMKIGGQRVQKMIRELRAAKTPQARNALIREQSSVSGKIWGVAGEAFLNSILSGITTHGLNVGSSAINLAVRPLLRVAGSRGNKDEIIKGLSQELFTFSQIFESLHLFHATGGLIKPNGYQWNSGNTLVNSMRVLWNDTPVLDASRKIGDADNTSRAITAQAFGLNDTPFETLIDLTGNITRLPQRAIGVEDEFFKHIAFRSKVKADATVDALNMSLKDLEGLGFNQGGLLRRRIAYVRDATENAFNTKQTLSEKWRSLVREGRVLDDADAKANFIQQNLGSYNQFSKYAQSAIEEARAVTFTTPLTKESMMYGLQKWVNSVPALRQIVPFVQTPTNVLRENFERVPVIQSFMKGLQRDLKSDDASVRALAEGKLIYGYGMTIAALYLTYQGRLTGSGPSYATNPELAKIWAQSKDWQPNSLRIENEDGTVKFYDMSKLLPHFGAFTMVGQFYEYVERTEGTDDDVSLWFGGLVSMFASQVTMQSSLSGIGDFMRIATGDAQPYEVEKYFSQKAASMMPLGNLQYGLNKDADGIMRDLTDFSEVIKSRIWSPILENADLKRNAPAVFDWLTGEPKNSPDYIYKFIKKKRFDGDDLVAEVFQELRKLDQPLTGPKRSLYGREISPAAYQKLNELYGTIKNEDGKTLIQSLYAMINEPLYDKEGKAQPYGISSFRRDLLQSVVTEYRGRALEAMVDEFPELAKFIENQAEAEGILLSGGMPENPEVLEERFELPMR